MDFRYRIEIYIPENSRETEEILVLAPAAGGPFENLHGEPVDSLPHIRRQIKLCRGKAVLAVPHIAAVEPESHSAFDPLEGNAHRAARPSFRKGKAAYIRPHRVEDGRHFTRGELLTAVPRILRIDILRPVVPRLSARHIVIAGQLDVAGNTDVIPPVRGDVIAHEILRRGVVIDRVSKFPDPVQGKHEIAWSICEKDMVRMRGKTILRENCRVCYVLIGKCCHSVLLTDCGNLRQRSDARNRCHF